MAEITSKRIGEILRTIFSILINSPDGVRAKNIVEILETKMAISDFEKSTYPNRPDVRRIEKIARFSTITAVKAGWLQKTKGNWTVTESGKSAFNRFQDPEGFYRESVRLYREWKSNQPDTPLNDNKISEEEVEESATTLEEAEESSWSEIQKYLSEMNPYDFQNLVAGLLKALGYYVSWIAPPGKDGGIDILAFTDPLGTSTPRIKVQVKRRQDKITVDGLRSFMAVLGDQDVGIFVSIGGFTTDAESEARTQEKRKISLIGLEKLFDLWVENYSKISEEFKKLLPLRPVYFLEPKI